MPKFTLTLGLVVPVYRTIEVEADTPEAAAELVRQAATGPDPEEWWRSQDFVSTDDNYGEELRIVDLNDEDGAAVFQNVELWDDYTGTHEIISADSLTVALEQMRL